MNQTDMKLCEEVADLWQSKGGDAEGFLWCWDDIFRILKAREEAEKEGGNHA